MEDFFAKIGFVSFVPAGFWLGGYDFDERGATAVFCYFLCLVMLAVGVAANAEQDATMQSQDKESDEQK